MTILEQETLSAVKSAALKLTKTDWEQRRYEIARDLFTRKASESTYESEINDIAESAVRYADILIAELKKPKDTISIAN